MIDNNEKHLYAMIKDNIVKSIIVFEPDAQDLLLQEICSNENCDIYINLLSYSFVDIGYSWNEDHFRSPQPFASWTWNGEYWEAPIPVPQDFYDGKIYGWDEDAQVWFEA